MKIFKTLIVSLALLACCRANTNDLKIIQDILTQKYDTGDEGFVVFCQTTAVHSAWAYNTNLTEDLKIRVKQEFEHNETYDTGTLVEGFIEVNKQPIRLLLESSSSSGYVIDLDGHFERYFKELGRKGWKTFQKENPNAKALGHISRPFYDRKQNIIMVYVDMGSGPKAGAGYLHFYKYNEEGKLEIVDRIQLWIA